MTSPSRLHLKLPCFPDALHGPLHTSVDVLRTASMVWGYHHPAAPSPVSWEMVGPDGTTVQVPGLSHEHSHDDIQDLKPEQTLLVIPPLYARNSHQIGKIVAANSDLLDLVRRHAAAGGWLTATFTGIAIPGALGLLNGAKIGLPWMHHAWMTTAYPGLDSSGTEPISTHNRIFTCVAPDMHVRMIFTALAHLTDVDLATVTENFLSYGYERQTLISEVTRTKNTGKTPDSPVFRATQWLESHVEEPYCLPVLAEVAATSERTLLRHFHTVTGMSPLDYLHRLRVERAKIMLEVTMQTVDAIARACGYTDVASFRRLFRSATNMAPDAYRSRFTLRAPKTYWRVEDLD